MRITSFVIALTLMVTACERNVPQTQSSTGTTSNTPHRYSGEFYFKDIKLGMTEEDVRSRFPGLRSARYENQWTKSLKILTCETKYEGDSAQCRATIANQRIRKAQFIFSKNHLIAILIMFSESYYQTVAEGLISKYGQPISLQQDDLKNNLTGVPSTYSKAVWINESNQGLTIENHEIDGSYYRPIGSLMISDLKYNLGAGEKSDKDDL